MVGNRSSWSIQEDLGCRVFHPGEEVTLECWEWTLCRSRGVTLVSLVYANRQQ